MGMYDTVYFTCPKCGTEGEDQTKAGPCIMMGFDLDEPLSLEDALVVNGMTVNCYGCGTDFEVVGDLPKYHIHMQLKEEKK